MISPEQLRRYPFFGELSQQQLAEIAMIAEKVEFSAGEEVFQEGKPAEALYFLVEGCIDLFYTVESARQAQKGIPVGEINPGEPFGISALIEPFLLTSTAVASLRSSVILIDAVELRKIFKKDMNLGYLLTHQAACAAVERLHATRVQLAAAWA